MASPIYTGDSEIKDTSPALSNTSVQIRTCDHTAICDKYQCILCPPTSQRNCRIHDRTVKSTDSIFRLCELGNLSDNSIYSATV